MDEEARAALYRDNQRKRRLNRLRLLRALRGNHAARVALSDDWRPLALAQREAGRTERADPSEPYEELLGNA